MWCSAAGISIHALLAESDFPLWTSYNAVSTFLSTLSLRRATRDEELLTWSIAFLSTLSLRRATQSIQVMRCRLRSISIHALLAESDYHIPAVHVQLSIFLSTLSLRRATVGVFAIIANTQFLSTLSLRRATFVLAHVVRVGVFLSTLSLRRATQLLVYGLLGVGISIHALLAESDTAC